MNNISRAEKEIFVTKLTAKLYHFIDGLAPEVLGEYNEIVLCPHCGQPYNQSKKLFPNIVCEKYPIPILPEPDYISPRALGRAYHAIAGEICDKGIPVVKSLIFRIVPGDGDFYMIHFGFERQ